VSSINIKRIRQFVKAFDYAGLFDELGWDRCRERVEVTVGHTKYTLTGIAQKRGVPVFVCGVPTGQALPDHKTRRAIEQQLRRVAHEHVIVFTDARPTMQIWQWVRRVPAKPAVTRELTVSRGQSGERLAQALARVVFELSEEESLLQPHVVGRIARAFDTESVTRHFYERFRTEHERFLSFVDGIRVEAEREWYASLMLNRLMFVYFIQRKGFLDGDQNYLRNRLAAVKSLNGRDRFHSFYRYFLVRLFHDGLGAREPRKPSLDLLLGKVPYLNGGLFEMHDLERRHPDLDIPDHAFELIFDFFDSYQWHLDARRNAADNEINPDVLGFIFEKYVNQKQMGAYYTREDITSYIGANSIVPYIVERLASSAPTVFGTLGTAWSLLSADPQRYIPSAAQYGADRKAPNSITAGLKDCAARGAWRAEPPPEFGLPMETWRDVMARRAHLTELRGRLSAGNVRSPEELITLNLDALQFTVDAIQACDEPETLRSLYTCLASLTILDPACGSGAFLLAALAILQPLHEACLERMASLVQEAAPGRMAAYSDFVATLEAAAKHPDRVFFVLKSIVLRNLYGVDVMEEATEICKLRLFLKLAAQVDSVDDLEPLPDLDFNIRAGNSLVGFATFDEVHRAMCDNGQWKVDFERDLPRLRRLAERTDAAFERFRQLQTDAQFGGLLEAKEELKREFSTLRHELDRYLANEYGVPKGRPALDRWRTQHQPFHWFVEFYHILRDGGFDLIVGNPPYVELRSVAGQYVVRGMKTIECGDLYACFMERSKVLLRRGGRLGMIVPISAFGVDKFESLQRLLVDGFSALWVACFSNRPAQLFDGAQKRVSIVLGRKRLSDDDPNRLYTTAYLRWRGEERDSLFGSRIRYAERSSSFEVFKGSLEKLGSELEVSIFAKLRKSEGKLEDSLASQNGVPVYYTRKFGYFLLFLDRQPGVVDIRSGRPRAPSELKDLQFGSKVSAQAAIAVLSSTSFFWFWNVLSDCRNLNRSAIFAFPLDVDRIQVSLRRRLATLGARYLKELSRNSKWIQKSGLRLESFDYSACKPVIDEIDEALGGYFGLNAEQLDFLRNYDLKYRVGATEESEEDTESVSATGAA
jgi:hypothetical protein